LFPEAQLKTRAAAAFSAFGRSAPGMARVVVVGGRRMVVLVVGRVVGADASEVLQPVAVAPRITATATARMGRVRMGITIPL